MKRKDLVKYILSFGCFVDREGGSHTIFINPGSGQVSSVPTHKEINTFLGRKICKDLGIPVIAYCQEIDCIFGASIPIRLEFFHNGLAN